MEIQEARLGYRLAFRELNVDPPAQDVRLIAVFPEVRPDIGETTDIVWDLPQLCESIRRPGGYDVLTCSCGDGGHAGIWGLIFVAHPDEGTVVWEVDIPDHRPALDPRWRDASGFLRLVFRRTDYEADIRAMLDAVVNAGTPELPIDDYEPDRGGCVYEHLQELAAANQWSRLPVLRSGSVLEFQIMRNRFVLLDGKPGNIYAPRLFTRWAVSAAFDRWTDFFLMGRDLEENQRSACDEAGETFVAALRDSFAEGNVAPGVVVRYLTARPVAAC